ncbi:hypothetical protein [Rhodoplanes azumiensis]|uniref:Uncharacterized protein n=1 Tax=Rhodoplanes azumiensis TaxID=1897628 RepID=A0ABW5AJY6_9BRAD
MVGWPRLLRSTTAHALVVRFAKGVTIAGTATTAATLVLSAIQDTSPPDGPPRPSVPILRATTRIEPPAGVSVPVTVAVADRAPAPMARPEPEPERPAARPTRPGRSRLSTTTPDPTPPRAASLGATLASPAATPSAAASIEPPTVSLPLDLVALARTSEDRVEGPGRDGHWTFGSSLRLARSAAESATSKVLEWKHRVTSSIGSLLDVLL